MTLLNRLDRIAAGAALMIAGALAPQGVVAEVTLKVADTFPPGHYIVETGTRYWMDRVTELTDGEVKFQWVDTKGNLADALTKALALPQFQALTGQMRKLTVMGGKALSAMRAALAREASD